MVELIPDAEEIGHEAIHRVVESLGERGVEVPDLVFVEHSGESWRALAAGTPVERRRESVILLATGSSLLDAVRYEFGGAARIPVSSVSLAPAFEAAARGRRPGTPLATRGVVDSALGGAKRLGAVGWRRARFWRSHVGTRRLNRVLTDLALGLGCVPVILPGPVLLIPDRGRHEILSEIEKASRPDGTIGPPSIVPIDPIVAAMDITVEGIVDAGGPRPPERHLPVLELPTGRRLGTWSLSGEPTQHGRGWSAFPERLSASSSSWTLEHLDGSIESLAESASMTGQRVIKVPGWISDHLCSGSPAGLLVEGLATDRAREGRPLWVSNVDADGVRFLLGLPGPIWVDGPGVPSD
jgi:hypothetical protein